MWSAMNVKDLPITTQRHTVATKQLAKNLTGETGMDHSRSTARETYHDGKAQEGTLNKILTHSEIL